MKGLIILAALIVTSHLLLAQKTITGKITDKASGTALSGASIKIKGSKKGTSTNTEGVFTLEVNPQDILIISNVGYVEQTVAVPSTSSIDILLEPLASELTQVVFVGSRGVGRSKTESPVPVDVIKISDIGQNAARPDLMSQLNVSVPSFNYNKQSGGDGADAIDLATLRGLGPDQTLVLINGKRQHQTAFVALFGTRGRGNSGTDLNAIPEASIDRVEILRDGASAQYGSDAIAGVINIILKKDVNHFTGTAGWSGYYDHKYNSLNSIQPSQYVTGSQVDGQTFTASLHYGVPIGKKGGFLDMSGNFLTQGKTFRQVPDTDATANPNALPINNVRRANGDASVTSGGIVLNSEVPVGKGKTTFYAFGIYNYKNSNAYAYSRNFSGTPNRFPTDANGNLLYVPGIMHLVDPKAPVDTDPNTITSANDVYFNPQEDVHITDGSLAVGFRGTFPGGLDWDLSNTAGGNNFHYFGKKTFNASLGEAGINRNTFNDGGFYLFQNTVNADFSKNYSNVAGGNFILSFGAEYRYEQYGIYKGEEASYLSYAPGIAAGSQGFPGFQPADETNAPRTNVAGYVEGELDVTKQWLIDGAVRLENYSDFGFVDTYKFSTRYKVTKNFNLRGSVSTGFRAPSLQQINFSNTETNVQAGAISVVKIAPNDNPITEAAGIPKLKQENSFNASVGFAWKAAPNLTFTVDGYLVKIKNRVVLTGEFDTSIQAIAPALTQLGVNDAQFFANAVNTTNYGADLVADYNLRFTGRNSLKFLLATNINHLNINRINIPPALNIDYTHQQTFFSTREQDFVKASAPPIKSDFNVEYDAGKFGVGAHLTYYGKIILLGYGYDNAYPPEVYLNNTTTLVPEQFNYHGKMTTDIYCSYKFSNHFYASIGIDNLFNVHPDLGVAAGANESAYDGETGGPWDAVQMGFDGLRIFSKLVFNF